MRRAEDERVGQLVRLLRRRARISQRALAQLAGVPREDVMRIEDGRAGDVRLDRVRAVVDALGGRARLTAWWNGAAADRLLDERHAGLIETGVRVLVSRAFRTASEVTFADYSERGSVDLLGLHEASRMALVGEVKAYLGSLEETNRILDVKVRLGPKIVRSRFGVTPRAVSRVLVLPEDSTIRRVIERHSATMHAIYPAASRDFRAWLRNPIQPISAIWFLSEVAHGDRV